MIYLRLALILATLGGLWGVYRHIQHEGQQALALEQAEATIAQERAARIESDKAAEELRKRNQAGRRLVNVQQARLAAMAGGCMDSQLPLPADELFDTAINTGTVHKLRRATSSAIARARGQAVD